MKRGFRIAIAFRFLNLIAMLSLMERNKKVESNY